MEYNDIYKNVFIDGHKCLNVVEDWNNFLTRIEDLKLYIVEFEENSKMKLKIYPLGCIVEESDRQSIIVISYDKCTFFCQQWYKKSLD